MCPLCTQRDRICLARGMVPCDVLFIGEAPGASEDAIGQPFVGPAGELLDKIIDRALEQWQVPGTVGPSYNSIICAYTNLVACFPREAKMRGDNEPEDGEILECRPRLIEFVNIAQPRLIVCVGGLASQYIDQRDTVPCVNLVHPAAILGHMKSKVQKDNAILRCTVLLRSAVADMVQSPRQPFKEWGKNAAITTSKGLKQRFDAWERDHKDIDIPF